WRVDRRRRSRHDRAIGRQGPARHRQQIEGLMARPRSADHDRKRPAILARSGSLFARNGYDRTSMAQVAAACGVSKALLYHYYTSKDALLYDILRVHLQGLVDVTHAVETSLPPHARLRALIGALLEA